MLLEVGTPGTIRLLGHEQPPICVSLGWTARLDSIKYPPQSFGATIRRRCLAWRSHPL